MIRVAIIGAGAAGLCVARYMVSKPEIFSPVVFEQTGSIGGTWVYTEETGKDSNGLPIHSSMYYNLRTNLPKEVMAFPDFPFPTDWRSYMHHTQVLEYLRSYSTHFGVDDVVQLNTAVTRVHPLKEGDSEKVTWEVTTNKVDEQKSVTAQFDAVVACNGHYSEVSTPDIPGMNLFKGLVSHSHNYRHPEAFRDMDVVVLGAGASGWDIALDMASYARNVYLSHDNPQIQSTLPSKVEQLAPIKKIKGEETVEFKSGHSRRADAILFCTGYKYTFPFLSPQCRVTLDARGKRISSLYMHMFHTLYPSLVFVGVPAIVCPFPLISLQSQAAAAVLSGKSPLPSRAIMEANIEKDFQSRKRDGWPVHHAHRFAEKQWAYNASVAELAGCDNLAPRVQSLYEHSWKQRMANMAQYRSEEFCIIDENTWGFKRESSQKSAY